MLSRTLVVLAVLSLVVPASASAERAVGLVGGSTLLRFDTASPGTGTAVTISGFQTATETLIGIDWRPATGELFGVTVPAGSANNSVGRTYRLDEQTGTATFIGMTAAALAGLGDVPGGIDFNPRVDRIRLVQMTNENARLNPVNGSLAGNDTDLTFVGPTAGPVTATAYDRNVAPGPPGTVPPPTSLTTLYGIDSGTSRLVVQGGIDGAGPGGPNAGQITSIGPLGVTVPTNSDAGLDISPSGTAFATLSVAGQPRLYTVDLTTGTATLVGALPADVRSVAILAPDNCPGVAGDDQADFDGDGLGDACDADIDGDGVTNVAETLRGSDPRKVDSDADGQPDALDECPLVAAATDNGCPSPDRTAPSVRVDRLKRKLKLKAFLEGVSLRVRPSEAASLRVTLLASARRAGISKTFNLTLASRTLARKAGARTLKLKPSKRLVGKAKRFSVRIQVVATDAAGNQRTVRRTITVRP